MGFKPEVSLGLGAATVALVYGVYTHYMPQVIDVRTGGYNDPNIAASERQAAWTAAGIVAGVSLLAKDPIIFMVGGSALVALSWIHRYNNMVAPDMTMSMVPGSPDALSGDSIGYEPTGGSGANGQ